jgi:hypothetical protein
MSTTDNNLHVPDDVLALLAAKADAEHKTVDQIAEETLRAGLKGKSWTELLARGSEYGQKSGISEDDVVNVVHESRDEDRRR